MSSDATVNAGDIARLADVGRAAVSNWRRRYDDFPRPVGGTAASPLFSLREVEAWLRTNGKPYEVSPGDRVWQRLRACGDDLALPALVAQAGALLLYLRRDPGAGDRLRRRDTLDGLPATVAEATGDLPGEPWRDAAAGPSLDAETAAMLAGLAAEQGHRAAFELICERYAEAHSRKLDVTRGDVAALMARLAATGAATVLDPACGLGTLLLAAGAARALGQDTAEPAAVVAAVRLLLRGAHAEIISGDTLRRDGFPATSADAVVCHPPFNERAWGFDELTGDPRWEYGLPPRGESELAWVQHCLARVRPGGTVAILMPGAAASRRPGRRIRGNLLRAGALRGVMTLGPAAPDLWLLRRPAPGERPPSRLLLMDAADDLAAVEAAWLAYTRDPGAEPPGPGRTVRIIDLLDDEVDVSPLRHRPRRSGTEVGRGFAAALDRFRDVAAELPAAPPELDAVERRRDPVTTSVADLVKAGLVTVHQAAQRTPAGDGEAAVAVLTAADVTAGRVPTGTARPDPALVELEPGDIVTTGLGAVRVVETRGAVLGPYLTAYRVDPSRLDPHFLAGFLRFAGASGASRTGASRADARRARVPRLPLASQRAYGAAFRELVALEDGLRETAALGETLMRLGFEGLVDGHLRPRGEEV